MESANTLSEIEDGSFTHIWAIKNFKKAFDSERHNPFVIKSDEFPGEGRIWQMQIKSCANDELEELYLKVIKYKEGESTIDLSSCTFSFLDENNTVIDTVEYHEMSSFTNGFGCDRAISEKSINSNGNLIVKLTASTGEINYINKSKKQKLASYKVQEFPELSKDLKRLKNGKDFADFEIVTLSGGDDGNGKTFKVHKAIIYARSEYFRGMFNSGMKECQDGRLVIQNCSAEITEKLVDYIYTGTIKENPESLEDIFELSSFANLYLLKGLKCNLDEQIKSMTDLTNAPKVFRMANQYVNDKIIKFSKSKILKNLKQMKKLESFKAEAEEYFEIFRIFN